MGASIMNPKGISCYRNPRCYTQRASRFDLLGTKRGLGARAATRNLECYLGGTPDSGTCPSFLLIIFIAASYNLDRI